MADTAHERQQDDTERQIDELREMLAARRRVRDAGRQRLDSLEEQAARMGIDTPPHITNEIVGLSGKLKERDGEIAEIEKKLALLERGSPPPLAFLLPDVEPHIPILVPAIVEARLKAIQRMLEQILESLPQILAMARTQEQVSEALARLAKRDEGKDTMDAEWRAAERKERHEGQQDRRQRDRILVAVLFVLALSVVLIAIKVY